MLEKIRENIEKLSHRNAFYINKQFYTYLHVAQKLTAIREKIREHVVSPREIIGVITDDAIETYAAILSIWFEKHVFLPINPSHPPDRIKNILDQTGLRYVLTIRDEKMEWLHEDSVKRIIISGLEYDGLDLSLSSHEPEDLMYVLFTSGSTGIPKGVKISYRNLSSFVTNFLNIGYRLDESDRFLQIYDLTFDASVHCYLVPLYVGGCVYTVPQQVVKYLYAYKLMNEHDLTFVKMPPSTLGYLRPYFKGIKLEKLKYCLLGGEAFYADLAREWARCVPNCLIQNVYGPTEATINCTYHDYNNSNPQVYNGVVSIGKTFGDSEYLILDKKGNMVNPGQKGELCVAGDQVTPGYWKNEGKNKENFIIIKCDNSNKRYYKTGDLVFMNKNSNLMYCGRMDNQVQINGYRVELGEIENSARSFTGTNTVAIPVTDHQGRINIVLFIENYKGSSKDLSTYLEQKLPSYMLPRKIENLKSLPVSPGGKINRGELTKLAGISYQTNPNG